MESHLLSSLDQQYPLIRQLRAATPLYWSNSKNGPTDQGISYVGLTRADIQDASDRLARFAPYFVKAFPETAVTQGIIESPVVEISQMKHQLEAHFKCTISGHLMVKLDSQLPISGSIKARGGIYEVLVHAERIAVKAGLISYGEDYSKLFSPAVRQLLGQYTIAVGSTGNLGLSIGIMSAKLGFSVTVHMSADARQWKKDLLRERGVEVIEYQDDYGVAVENGRRQAASDPSCIFIDDENSKHLFLGYSVAGERLKQQFAEQGLIVDAEHPLVVYLPCGVGGGPGGVAFGLKMAFGDHVHCVFAEPTHSPCMLLGVMTGLHDGISVIDIGLDNVTEADGLAVGRASGFVGKAMEHLLGGFYTVEDTELYQMLALLKESEGFFLEPSALAGMSGPTWFHDASEQVKALHVDPANITHLVWATGGGMVPSVEKTEYLSKAKASLV